MVIILYFLQFCIYHIISTRMVNRAYPETGELSNGSMDPRSLYSIFTWRLNYSSALQTWTTNTWLSVCSALWSHQKLVFGYKCNSCQLIAYLQRQAMMVPLIKNAHPAESNEISQPEITSREEMLPTHSASRVAPTNPSAIAQLSDGYGQIAEVSILCNLASGNASLRPKPLLSLLRCCQYFPSFKINYIHYIIMQEPVHNGSTRAERFDNSQTSGIFSRHCTESKLTAFQTHAVNANYVQIYVQLCIRVELLSLLISLIIPPFLFHQDCFWSILEVKEVGHQVDHLLGDGEMVCLLSMLAYSISLLQSLYLAVFVSLFMLRKRICSTHHFCFIIISSLIFVISSLIFPIFCRPLRLPFEHISILHLFSLLYGIICDIKRYSIANILIEDHEQNSFSIFRFNV